MKKLIMRWLAIALSLMMILGFVLQFRLFCFAKTNDSKEINATIYTDASYKVISSDKSSITVSGVLPNNTVVRAYPVKTEVRDSKVLASYNISLFKPANNGIGILKTKDSLSDYEVYEPTETVTVAIKLQNEIENADYSSICYVPESGVPEKMPTTVINNIVSFQTSHFSTYALTVPKSDPLALPEKSSTFLTNQSLIANESILGIPTSTVDPNSFGEVSDCTIDYTAGHLPIIFDSCTCTSSYVVKNITQSNYSSIYPYTTYGIWGSGETTCTTGKVIYLQSAPAGTVATIKVTYPIVGEYNGVKVGAHVTYQITSARSSPQAALMLGDSLFNGVYEYGISRNEVTIQFFYYNEGMTNAELSAAASINVANSYYTLHSLSYGRYYEAPYPSKLSEEVDFDPNDPYTITKLQSAIGGDIALEPSAFNTGQINAYATSTQTGADDYVDSPTFWKHSITCYQSGAYHFITHHGPGTDTQLGTTCYWWAPSSSALNHAVPPPPTKTVSDSDETDVTSDTSAIGETLTYKVNQQVGMAGITDTGKYTSFAITDTLPAGVQYVAGSAQLYVYTDGMDETKTPALPAGTGTSIALSSTTATVSVSGDASTGQTVTLTFASDYLLNSMTLRGQAYQLRFNVKILDNVTTQALENTGGTLDNRAHSTFDSNYTYNANETHTRIPGITSVSVQKTWSNCTPAASIQVQLYADGVAVGSTVVITAADSWFHLWSNLPEYNTEGNAIAYTVSETPTDGYASTVTEGTPPTETVSKTVQSWTSATSLQVGETYLLISNSGALANTSNDLLSWVATDTGGDAAATPLTSQWVASASGSYFKLTNKSSGRDLSFVYDTAYWFRATNLATTYTVYSKNISYNSSHLGAYYATDNFIYLLKSDLHSTGVPSEAATITLYKLTATTTTTIAPVSDKHFNITNTGTYELPATGGIGTLLYQFAGWILITVTSLIGGIWKSKHRGEKSL